jgi:hypothetical protein
MPACSNRSSRPPPEVIGRLVDAVAWAKTCLLITAATLPGSAQRAAELDKLRAAVVEARRPRRRVDKIFGRGQALPPDLIGELRSRELAIPRLEAGAVLRQHSQQSQQSQQSGGAV